MNIETTVDRLHKEAPLTDIHAHPSLKAWLFGQDLWGHSFCPGMYFPLCCRSRFEALERGGVGVIWVSHTVPEIEMLRRSFLTRLGARFSGLYDRLMSGSELGRWFEMMEVLEREVGRGSEKVGIARSLDDVKALREENKVVIVNAIEGANVLGGDPENLDELADSGVACFTLSHLFTDDIVATVDPVPDYSFVKKILSFESSREDKPPLTELGESILSRLEELDMVLDVAHCTPEARNRIYDFFRCFCSGNCFSSRGEEIQSGPEKLV